MMDVEEAEEFRADLGLGESATTQVIRASYGTLGLVSFLTVGEDEVRAWSVPGGMPAVSAAGVIHTDFTRGFIRAEVIAYDDYYACGSMVQGPQGRSAALGGEDLPGQGRGYHQLPGQHLATMIVIRQFRAEDAEAVLNLFLHAQDDFTPRAICTTRPTGRGFTNISTVPLHMTWLTIEQSYLQRPGSNFWIAELEGQAVGCVGAYRRDEEEAEIRRLVVDGSARRRGVASQLLEQAEEFCRDAGYARAIVWTANHMSAAIAFLRHRGYHELEDHAFPHTSLTLYLYALDLH